MTTSIREFLREEFQLRRLGFVDCSAEDFGRLKWTHRLPLVVVYRVVVALYCLAWFIADIVLNRDPLYLTFLTHWGEVVMCLYFGMAIYSVIQNATSGSFNPLPVRSPQNSPPLGVRVSQVNNLQETSCNSSTRRDVLSSLRWWHKVTWVLLNLNGDLAFFISILYWVGVSHGLVEATSSMLAINIHVHAINSILLLLELLLNDLPVRLLHFYFSLIFGAIFILFTLILHWADVTSAVYPVLDWSSNPATAVGFGVAALACCSLVSHAMVYAIYAAKTLLFRRYAASAPQVVTVQAVDIPLDDAKERRDVEKDISAATSV